MVSFTFNPNGTIQSKAVGYNLSTTSGKASSYSYDQYGNLTSDTDALGRQTTYTYDTLGRKTSMTSPGGGVTSYAYDALSRLKTVTAPLGRVTSYTYDANGNKTSETDANNHTTTYQYDALNRLILTTYPTTPATTMSYSYNFRNNVVDATDQAARVTHNIYDVAGRLNLTVTANNTPDASQTSFTYYDDGRKKTESDALGHTTTYNYDAAGRLTSTVDAQSHTTQYAYDAVVFWPTGRRLSTTVAILNKFASAGVPGLAYAFDWQGALFLGGAGVVVESVLDVVHMRRLGERWMQDVLASASEINHGHLRLVLAFLSCGLGSFVAAGIPSNIAKFVGGKVWVTFVL